MFASPQLRATSIDARGRAVGEDALLALRGVDERADRFPGLVEQFVRLLGQLVDAAMHVGIVLFVATRRSTG